MAGHGAELTPGWTQLGKRLGRAEPRSFLDPTAQPRALTSAKRSAPALHSFEGKTRAKESGQLGGDPIAQKPQASAQEAPPNGNQDASAPAKPTRDRVRARKGACGVTTRLAAHLVTPSRLLLKVGARGRLPCCPAPTPPLTFPPPPSTRRRPAPPPVSSLISTRGPGSADAGALHRAAAILCPSLWSD